MTQPGHNYPAGIRGPGNIRQPPGQRDVQRRLLIKPIFLSRDMQFDSNKWKIHRLAGFHKEQALAIQLFYRQHNEGGKELPATGDG